MTKILRSICLFRESPHQGDRERLSILKQRFVDAGWVVQTERVCYQSPLDIEAAAQCVDDDDVYVSAGSIRLDDANASFNELVCYGNVSWNIPLMNMSLGIEYVEFLFRLMHEAPQKTFSFSYLCGRVDSCPFFPSATYGRPGFALGLQSLDLVVDCATLDEWFARQREAWSELCALCSEDDDFLGIDTSIAPLHRGDSSLVGAMRRLGHAWSQSILSNMFMQMSEFVKVANPQPVGLCGLMFPCLEDFELAALYERGEFSLERNLFLSMHSGLGIDTYPLGMDESPERVLNVLKLTKSLAARYDKPLSVRFVSDGSACIGDRTNFQNPYLRDVTVRSIGL